MIPKCFLKCRKEHVVDVSDIILQNHSYEIVPIEGGHDKYMQWIVDMTE
jgi:uncharacterized protein involved in tolerance to divalent cations